MLLTKPLSAVCKKPVGKRSMNSISKEIKDGILDRQHHRAPRCEARLKRLRQHLYFFTSKASTFVPDPRRAPAYYMYGRVIYIAEPQDAGAHTNIL
jgi:hypothetical protein